MAFTVGYLDTAWECICIGIIVGWLAYLNGVDPLLSKSPFHVSTFSVVIFSFRDSELAMSRP